MKLSKLILAISIVSATSIGCGKKSIEPNTPATPETPATPTTPQTPVMPVNYITLSTNKGLPNSTITISGSGFSTDLSKILVQFENAQTTAISATATEVVVDVPLTAKTGKVKVISDGTTYTTASNFAVLEGTLTYFTTMTKFRDIAIDANGNIFAGSPSFINKLSATGDKSPFATFPFGGAALLAVDAAGNVYTTDYSQSQIIKVSPSGTAAPIQTTAQINQTTAMTTDAAGNLWVSDAGRIRKVSPDGTVTNLVNGGSGFVDGPAATAKLGVSKGIVVDAAGNIYTDDNKSIRKITPAGTVTTIAGNGTAGFNDGRGSVARFNNPAGMAIDSQGNIFVIDGQSSGSGVSYAYNYTIKMVSKTGQVSTLIKTGSSDTSVDSGVTSLAVDPNGNLYIVDYRASVINKLTFN